MPKSFVFKDNRGRVTKRAGRAFASFGSHSPRWLFGVRLLDSHPRVGCLVCVFGILTPCVAVDIRVM